ncbi:THO complex subunit 7 homolog [Oscarella lobularis]|uniref:THO complex subunit 7 homolog n=1 Tax=Oscarella lobularis TaxID=121494 RepID=UPI00331441D7
MAAAEEEIIRRRLLYDGDGSGDDRRLTTFLRTFIKWCNSDASPEEQSSQYQRLLVTLSQCDFAMAKTDMVCEMNEKELERYETIYKKIETGINDAKKKINDCQEELKEARRIRKHRQEYDALAKIIGEHPVRQDSIAQMKTLEADLADLRGQKEAIDQKLEMRRKQFHVLMYSIQEMQKLLEDEADSPMETES